MTKLLLVDDDPSNTMLLKTLLELDGYDVMTVSRGTDALPAAEKFQPHFVLIDYHLNDMHGVDVLRAMRQHPRFHSTPIVITSGMDMSEEVLAAGANAFLTKPFDNEQLGKLIHQFT